MKIGILHGYGLEGSGSSVYTFGLAQALVDIGHDVHVLCHEPSLSKLSTRGELSISNSSSAVCHAEYSNRLKIHAYSPEVIPVCYARPDIPKGTLLSTLTEAKSEAYIDDLLSWLECVNEKVDFDCLLVNHLALLGEVALRFQASRQCPYAIIVHGTGLVYGFHASPIVRQSVRRAVLGAECIVALNDSVLSRLRQALPQGGYRSAVIPPGTSASLFSFAAQQVPRRGISYVGRATLDKGLHCLLAALPLIGKEQPEIQLTVVGNGPELQSLKTAWNYLRDGKREQFTEVCRRAAIATRSENDARALLAPLLSFLAQQDESYVHHAKQVQVVWAGQQSRQRVASLLQRSALVVLPSLVPEAHPLSLCEAISCGAPVLGTDRAGIRYILNEIESLAPNLRETTLIDRDPAYFIRSLAQKANATLSHAPSPDDLRVSSQYIHQQFRWKSVASALVNVLVADETLHRDHYTREISA